ncbi:rhodanese-like domain-containing protein [Bacteriovorax sp. Seq25_V]|uniref:rhodanese-like domain-containing protein n=1 Tax=Bacteriovorax sp. Seq25_V TaxID=1201288 RepID=UPI00038A0BBB|nr:rhodanese-like domain-containing protein [Bacteriovorax sp. Seq25_V]EQC45395.1 rhodanese-like protein [Bacteriovorax sp. Seq25_V]
MDLKFYQMLEFINNRLTNIERNITKIDEKLDYSLALQRNHLIRVKNGQFIDDNMILMGLPYNDLTPERAHEIYENADMDYIILDVSRAEYLQPLKLEGAVHIPFEELDHRYAEIQNKTTPIMVISETGLRSIRACELLVKKGYFNVNNISGGYQFWPASQSGSKMAAA